MSYSSFSLFEKAEEEFYLKYLSENRPPKMPQEEPAAVGSAFDAFAKAELHAALFGRGSDPKYEFVALFEAQVEQHNWDFALPAGKHVFKCYKHTGLYDELLAVLQRAIKPPRFEFDVHCEILGVPFLAKPDCHAVLPGDIDLVHDFKVNGYCSKRGVSPNKGYRTCLDGFTCPKGRQSRSHNKAHKQFTPMDFHGLIIDEGHLEDCSTQWADQTSLYAWALGAEVGSTNTVLQIHQAVGKPNGDDRPILRFAEFRSRVRKSYQEHLAKRFTRCWEVINSGYIFRDMTEEESRQRCELLDGQSTAMTVGGENDDFFNATVRHQYRG